MFTVSKELLAIQEQITNSIVSDLNNQFDRLIIQGLGRHGYVFKNDLQIRSFIEENCSVTDFIDRQERIYHVKGIPFLAHSYRIEIEPISNTNNKTTISANYGRFAFL